MQIYPLYPSCVEGAHITLCIEPGCTCRIAFFRQDDDEQLTSLLVPKVSAYDRTSSYVSKGGPIIKAQDSSSDRRFDQDWQWPSLTYDLNDMEWKTGVYFAVVYPVQLDGHPADQLGNHVESKKPLCLEPPDSDSMAMFVVTPQSRHESTIVYVVPIATYHAYNPAGGGSFYVCKKKKWPTNDSITYRRPGGGVGDSTISVCEPLDYYDPRSPRHTFSHWDGKFIRWLLAEGYRPDFYTDIDLDRSTILGYPQYKLLISAGHHEYWSKNMRSGVEEFIAGGGNYALFSGNTCYRQITFNYQKATIEKTLADPDTWPDNDEERLIGVTFAAGGGWWEKWDSCTNVWTRLERTALGYKVMEPRHWAFQRTGLKYGDEFGKEDSLVGYECDGVRNLDTFRLRKILAEARLGDGWNEGSHNKATIVIYGRDDTGPEKKGLVFNAATTDWARAMQNTSSPSASVIRQITDNVLKTLS